MKLVGAMLRLDSFNAKDLATAARVDLETTRSFLKVTGKTALAVKVRSRHPNSGASSAAVGRPSNLYRLAPKKRPEAIRLMAEYRASAASLGEFEVDDGDREMTSMSLLENSVKAIEEATSEQERSRSVAAARMLAEGAIRTLVRLPLELDELRSRLQKIVEFQATIRLLDAPKARL
jgi:predicted ArsR family transcriptional regulator